MQYMSVYGSRMYNFLLISTINRNNGFYSHIVTLLYENIVQFKGEKRDKNIIFIVIKEHKWANLERVGTLVSFLDDDSCFLFSHTTPSKISKS